MNPRCLPRDRTGGAFGLKEGTLYPVLYRLEDGGLIVPEWTRPEPPAGGRGVPRKVYRLTDAGERRLAQLIAAWRGFEESVNAALAPRATAEEDA